MRRDDAAAVAAIRTTAVREGLLAILGPAAGRAFFSVAIVDPDTFGFVTEDGQGINGFVLLTTAALRIERRAVLGTPRLWPRALLAVRAHGTFRRGLRLLRAIARPDRILAADPEPRLRLLDVAVDPRAQGQGLGRRLLETALAEAWRRGHASVGLSVVDDNLLARHLYTAVGFRITGTGVRDDGSRYEVMQIARPAASD